jgi:SAM-dependent methyltransferase
MSVFGKSAEYYDAIYTAMKDYEIESERIHAVIQEYGRSDGADVLDVACGTGIHIGHLSRHYTAAGLDIDPAMLAIARRKHPRVAFHEASMVDFALGRQYDAVLCLFAAIAYAQTVDRLRQTLRTIAAHTRPGGVVLVEPFIPPERWVEGHVGANFVDQPELKVARMVASRRDGRIAILDFHFLVATPDGVNHFTERHDLALFTHEEYLEAFRGAGLETSHDPDGLMGRGLYIGVKPSESNVGADVG